jgi:hypothetical protein
MSTDLDSEVPPPTPTDEVQILNLINSLPPIPPVPPIPEELDNQLEQNKLAEDKTKAQEDKAGKTRSLVAAELVSTEVSYVNGLIIAKTHFIDSMKVMFSFAS